MAGEKLLDGPRQIAWMLSPRGIQAAHVTSAALTASVAPDASYTRSPYLDFDPC